MLTGAAAPVAGSGARDSGKDVDRPRTIVATPKIATASSSLAPTRRSIGRTPSATAIAMPPMASALRIAPRPSGPTSRMSRA